MRLIGLAVILALSLFIVMRAQNHRFSAARLNLARKEGRGPGAFVDLFNWLSNKRGRGD